MSDCTSRDISTGPKCCQIVMPWVDCEFRNQLDMKTKQFAMRINRLDPSKNQYMVGPGMFSLEDPLGGLGNVVWHLSFARDNA